MGKTKKDKIRGKYKAKSRVLNWRDSWNLLSEEEKLTIINYSKNPAWFNRIYNRKNKRANDRDKLKKIDLNDPGEGIVFSDNRKPKIYYW